MGVAMAQSQEPPEAAKTGGKVRVGVVAERRICRRRQVLDPGNAEHSNYFNEDADMVQRAMIQILYLDKGRLTEYRIGKYDKNAKGFYKRAASKKPWSAIADEVWNMDKFILHTASHSYKATQRQVKAIWDQYRLIMAAGRLATAINQTTPNVAQYLTYRTTAVTQSGLTFPAAYSEVDCLNYVCKREGTRAGVATHCYAITGSLYWNSLKIGENNNATGGTHTYTDGGLGWGSVQPYNAGSRNLYDPQQNVTKIAEMIEIHYNTAAAIQGNKARIWHAVYGYHHGSMSLGSTPAQLRINAPEPADYADNVFNRISAPYTPLPNANTD